MREESPRGCTDALSFVCLYISLFASRWKEEAKKLSTKAINFYLP